VDDPATFFAVAKADLSFVAMDGEGHPRIDEIAKEDSSSVAADGVAVVRMGALAKEDGHSSK
jgi:hypothetical protein